MKRSNKYYTNYTNENHGQRSSLVRQSWASYKNKRRRTFEESSNENLNVNGNAQLYLFHSLNRVSLIVSLFTVVFANLFKRQIRNEIFQKLCKSYSKRLSIKANYFYYIGKIHAESMKTHSLQYFVIFIANFCSKPNTWCI